MFFDLFGRPIFFFSTWLLVVVSDLFCSLFDFRDHDACAARRGAGGNGKGSEDLLLAVGGGVLAIMSSIAAGGMVTASPSQFAILLCCVVLCLICCDVGASTVCGKCRLTFDALRFHFSLEGFALLVLA